MKIESGQWLCIDGIEVSCTIDFPQIERVACPGADNQGREDDGAEAGLSVYAQ